MTPFPSDRWEASGGGLAAVHSADVGLQAAWMPWTPWTPVAVRAGASEAAAAETTGQTVGRDGRPGLRRLAAPSMREGAAQHGRAGSAGGAP